MSDKHLVCKGATVYCSKSMVNNSPGTAIPLTITSNTLVELNGGKVAATDKDCTPANKIGRSTRLNSSHSTSSRMPSSA